MTYNKNNRTTPKIEQKTEKEFVDRDVVLVMSKTGKSVNLYINEDLNKDEVLIISTANIEKMLEGQYKGTGFSQIVDKE